MPSTSTTCSRPLHAVGNPGEPRRTPRPELGQLARVPWTLRVGSTPMIVRPSTARDLAAVAHMHSRCSARSLLDRYRCGGRAPAVAALDEILRDPFSVFLVVADGSVVAHGTLDGDPAHNHLSARIGLLVQDSWHRLGIGAELIAHLAGVAQSAGYHELIAYPATAVAAAQRLMLEVGRTRMVPGGDLHLHTYLPESAGLGLGSVRQRLVG